MHFLNFLTVNSLTVFCLKRVVTSDGMYNEK